MKTFEWEVHGFVLSVSILRYWGSKFFTLERRNAMWFFTKQSGLSKCIKISSELMTVQLIDYVVFTTVII